jgi:hypothetical protein
MSTNKTKHEMLKLARKIANTEYKDKTEIHRGLDGSITGKSWYPAGYFLSLDIKNVLREHPEFDEDRFKEMVRDFIKNPGIEEQI